jgi:hypothetical protein
MFQCLIDPAHGFVPVVLKVKVTRLGLHFGAPVPIVFWYRFELVRQVRYFSCTFPKALSQLATLHRSATPVFLFYGPCAGQFGMRGFDFNPETNQGLGIRGLGWRSS